MLNPTLHAISRRLIVSPPLTALLIGIVWALASMTLSRYWVVPTYIPSENGHILGDPLLYHSMALEQVNIIREQGWDAFQLHYGHQGTAGVTSLLYLIHPSPFLVLILNALLHGLACAAVTRLLMVWFRPGVSLIATLPLLISPANIFCLAQINKESYAIAGCALFFLGYTLSLNAGVKGKFAGWWILMALTGIFLVYVPRPHLNQMLMLGFFVTSGLVVATILIRKNYKGALFVILQAAILTTAFGIFSQGGHSDRIEQMVSQAAHEDTISRTLKAIEDPGSLQAPPIDGPIANPDTQDDKSPRAIPTPATEATPNQTAQPETPLAQPQEPIGVNCYRKLESANWRPADWLPAGVNSRLKALASIRCHNHELHDVHDNPTTKQSIADADTSIAGVDDMLAYAPRALQLGFFGPLPSQWPSDSFLSSFFYTIVPVMMIFFYVAVAVTSGWIYKNKAWLVLPIFMISAVPLWIYGMSTSFLGALFRYRYPIWIVLFCICAAGLLTVFMSWYCRKAKAVKDES